MFSPLATDELIKTFFLGGGVRSGLSIHTWAWMQRGGEHTILPCKWTFVKAHIVFLCRPCSEWVQPLPPHRQTLTWFSSLLALMYFARNIILLLRPRSSLMLILFWGGLHTHTRRFTRRVGDLLRMIRQPGLTVAAGRDISARADLI